MLFNSLSFLIFFPIVLLVYYILPNRVKNFWLLVCSYYFYMCWNAKYAFLIFLSTAITYISGILLQRAKESGGANVVLKKKMIVAGSFISNLGILFYFKYFNFGIAIINKVLQMMHIENNIHSFDIILPVGISFYTFQALSYTMDVYRDEIYAEKNFFQYALFVSFFPQLVAGPIERSKNLLRQLAEYNPFSFERFKEGILVMIWGYFLKLVLADRIAIFVDCVYGNYEQYNGIILIVATVLFAIQIYCDFYGYSTIAVGAAKIIGIDLMENFNAPYLATSVSGFWRNWHISLTSWFKDYLYIPLGGSRKGKARKFINKMVVFLTSGLWHGADLSYVIWGGINGLYQVMEEILNPISGKFCKSVGIDKNSEGFKVFKLLWNFLLVDFSWIFFRAPNYHIAFDIIKTMLKPSNPIVFWNGDIYSCGLDSKNFGLMLVCVLILLVADIYKRKGIAIRVLIMKQDSWCQSFVVAFSICAILLFGIWGYGYEEASFIYFQF